MRLALHARTGRGTIITQYPLAQPAEHASGRSTCNQRGVTRARAKSESDRAGRARRGDERGLSVSEPSITANEQRESQIISLKTRTPKSRQQYF